MTVVVVFYLCYSECSKQSQNTCYHQVCDSDICMIKIEIIIKGLLNVPLCIVLLKQLCISCLSFEYKTSVMNIHFLSYEYHESLRV